MILASNVFEILAA